MKDTSLEATVNPIENDCVCRRWLTFVWFVCVVAGLVERNRNVILSECHLYDNHGIGVFMDRLNLQQINLTNCHISYNDGGGVLARSSEIRNLHIGTCDIEGNMGDANSEPTANVLLDSSNSSIGEVAITGCTIQHTHDAPNSANIRILGRSLPVQQTDELRHGNITIANNVTPVRFSTFIRVVDDLKTFPTVVFRDA